jgi:hypothetical protein
MTMGQIVAAMLANDTITATQIATDAIGSSELADNSVDTANIIANAVTQAWSTTATTANPSTTQLIGSGSVLMAEMSVGINSAGGPLLFLFEGVFHHSISTTKIYFDLYWDSTLQARREPHFTSGYQESSSLMFYKSGLASGAHTVQIRWATTAGTANAYDVQRCLTVLELRR